jgi:sarcosine oxidase
MYLRRCGIVSSARPEVGVPLDREEVRRAERLRPGGTEIDSLVAVRIAVVGAGVVGMSAAAALLDADQQVTCFEAGAIMGERSAGGTRIFRLAHVDPTLVRLALRAQHGFARWSRQAGRPMLVGSGCVITGSDTPACADAMTKAGADFELVGRGSGRLRLPVNKEPAAGLVDLGGGVVDVDAVRDHLTARAGGDVVNRPVHALAITPGGAAQVMTATGAAEYDALVLAAGANTSHLGAQVGIYTPPLVAHHVRFTFRVDGDDWQSWIDKPAEGFGTYQHRSGPGRWAVGGHVDPALTAWQVGRDAAYAVSRDAVLDYAERYLAVEPTIVDSLYCTTARLGDGVEFRRNGPVLAIYGDNLMKFAPTLGNALAAAVVDGTTPTVDDLVATPL